MTATGTSKTGANTTEPLKGDVTISDESGSVIDLVAYEVVNESARSIVAEIFDVLQGEPDARILIVDQLDMSKGETAWVQVTSQMTFFEDLFKKQITNSQSLRDQNKAALEAAATKVAGAAALSVLPVSSILTALASAATFLSYFRVDYAFTGRKVTLAPDAVMASVAGEITRRRGKQPNTLPRAYMIGLNLNEDESIGKQLASLMEKKREAESLQNEIEVQIPELEQVGGLAGLISNSEQVVAEGKALVEKFDAFLGAISTSADEKTPSVLAQAVLRATIKNQKFTHLLFLKPVSGGGEIITQKSLLLPTKIRFLGGSAISYVLSSLELGGEVLLARTLVSMAELSGIPTTPWDSPTLTLLPVHKIRP